ncbi:MAG: ATP-dependent Clp protease adaptor ClpS [Leptolyngbya sp. PLA3]|nr:MAG: ATP-dependent Clp protease adaptor ClpS [Cyanobacteria bacterium CYA]MCE7969704.1 ATP-dependent Clp protease adaptor ClpS [Leptolyngbya sp. PL-A3]
MSDAPVMDNPRTSPSTTPPKVDRLPPFHLVLHNDDVNDMGHVVDALTSVTPVRQSDAQKIMITAHFRGWAIVMTTHRERAELYRDRLRSKALVATVEPAE